MAAFWLLLRAGFLRSGRQTVHSPRQQLKGLKLKDVGPKDLDRYVKHMRQNLGLGAKTCKRRIAGVSTYCKWMVREGRLPADSRSTTAPSTETTGRKSPFAAQEPRRSRWLHSTFMAAREPKL
jgi:site-specific recombinase XerD